MESYVRFAALYDKLTFDVDYKKMVDFIETLIKKHIKNPKLILDLACGTGTVTSELSMRGYDMIGIDASSEMLSFAKEKKNAEKILFLNQTMQEFELYGTVDSIVCVLDSINYLTDTDDLKQVFSLCANYLEDGGLLIFDINSEYKFKNILKDNTFAYEKDDLFYVWENDFSEEDGLCDFYLTFFKENDDGLYERFSECHTEKSYSEAEIEKLLDECGLEICGKFDGYSENEVNEFSERIVYAARNLSREKRS